MQIETFKLGCSVYSLDGCTLRPAPMSSGSFWWWEIPLHRSCSHYYCSSHLNPIERWPHPLRWLVLREYEPTCACIRLRRLSIEIETHNNNIIVSGWVVGAGWDAAYECAHPTETPSSYSSSRYTEVANRTQSMATWRDLMRGWNRQITPTRCEMFTSLKSREFGGATRIVRPASPVGDLTVLQESNILSSLMLHSCSFYKIKYARSRTAYFIITELVMQRTSSQNKCNASFQS